MMLTSFLLLPFFLHGATAHPFPNSICANVHVTATLRSATRLKALPPFRTSDVTPSMLLSEENPVHPDLFGPVRDMVAKPEELAPYYHPRIVVNKQQWDDILTMYANPENFNKEGTWAKFFRYFSAQHGPHSDFIKDLAELERTGGTAAYQARPFENTAEYQQYRLSLLPLAKRITSSNSFNADSFVLCTLWASVARKQAKQGQTPFIPVDTINTCIDAAVAWSKVTLAHRTFFCNPLCPTKYNRPRGEFTEWWAIWDTTQKFDLSVNWFGAGTGISFTYDLLYDNISRDQRTVMRSAIALFVMNRFAWGASITSTWDSPNAMIDPHRIFSNWAAYNSNLYLANLGIEGEDGFDAYATAVMKANNPPATGFNQGLHDRYSALLEEYIKHSFYADGSTFEDGYSYFLALREGSLGLLASHRRGSNVLGTPRFRNIIHNAIQMTEPWRCGNLIGHASGGGNLYNAYPALFRYAYPYGELPGMFWRMRYGNFKNNDPCRIIWGQSYLQLAFLGGEHNTNAESPATMQVVLQRHFMPSFYSPRRGLLIARSTISERATYIHFDARPDAAFVGHDNADRGVFTFTALRQTWMDELPWRQNFDSRRHSLMHVDGLAQDWKAPPAKMLKVFDTGDIVLAAADLTYVYNVHWSRDTNPFGIPPWSKVTVYNANGFATEKFVRFLEKEQLDPWTLGWPADDRATDLGFTDDMTLYGVPDVAFTGLWTWKRSYRRQPLDHIVRSAILVRSEQNDVGYGLIVDSVAAGPGSHVFESYLILNKAVEVDVPYSSCKQNRCKIVLKTRTESLDRRVDIHVITKGNTLSFRSETFGGSSRRLVIKSVRDVDEEFWMVLHPHEGQSNDLFVDRDTHGKVSISHIGSRMMFMVSAADHTVMRLDAKTSPKPSPMPTSTTSTTPTPTPSPTTQPSSMPSPTPSPTKQPSSTPTPTPSATTKPSSIPSPTPTRTTAPTPTSSPVPTSAALPMAPVHLHKSMQLVESQMEFDRGRFFHPTSARYQVVLTVDSKTNVWRQRQDKFVTCSPTTTVSTEFSVYDCGDDEIAAQALYMRRDCTLIRKSSPENRCRKFRTRFSLELTRFKRYVVVVSIFPRDSRPVLFIRHGTALIR